MKKTFNEDMELIKQNIVFGREVIKNKLNSDEYNTVLFLGNSGGGKTTLINYLIGNKLKIVKKGYPATEVIDVENQITNLKIGHDPKSETTIPNNYKDKDINFWDCPGFGDNRGAVQDISNAYYIKMLFDQYEKIKIIVTIPESSLGEKSDGFIRLMNSIASIFKDNSYMSGLDFVITKATTFDTEALVSRLLEIPLDKSCDELRKFLIQKVKNQQVGFFNKPTKEGGYIAENEEGRIYNLVKNNGYIENPEIGYPISLETKNIISELQSTLNDNIKQNIIIIHDLLKGYISSLKSEGMRDLQQSIASLRKLKDKLNVILTPYKDDQIMTVIEDILNFVDPKKQYSKELLQNIKLDSESLSFFKDLQWKASSNIKENCFILLNEVDNSLNELFEKQFSAYFEQITVLQEQLSKTSKDSLEDKKIILKKMIDITPDPKLVEACKDLIAVDQQDQKSYYFVIEKMKTSHRVDDVKHFYDKLINQYPKEEKYYSDAIKDLASLGIGLNQNISNIKEFYSKLIIQSPEKGQYYQNAVKLVCNYCDNEGYIYNNDRAYVVETLKHFYDKLINQYPEEKDSYYDAINCIHNLKDYFSSMKESNIKHFYDKLIGQYPERAEFYEDAIKMMDKYKNAEYVKYFYSKLINQYPEEKNYYYAAVKKMQEYKKWDDVEKFSSKSISQNLLLSTMEKDTYQSYIKDVQEQKQREENQRREEEYKAQKAKESSCQIFLVDKILYDNPFLNLDQETALKIKEYTGFSYNDLLSKTANIVKNGDKQLLEYAFENDDINFFINLIGEQNYEGC